MCLSRFPDQFIDIEVAGERIEMTIVRVIGDRVVLGFNAAREVSIHRREVRERIEQIECAKRRNKEESYD